MCEKESGGETSHRTTVGRSGWSALRRPIVVATGTTSYPALSSAAQTNVRVASFSSSTTTRPRAPATSVKAFSLPSLYRYIPELISSMRTRQFKVPMNSH